MKGGPRYDVTAIGAQVRIRLGEKILTRQVESAVGEGSQNEQTLHFGLGGHDGPVTLEIRWPDGVQQQTVSGQVDRTVEVTPGME